MDNEEEADTDGEEAALATAGTSQKKARGSAHTTSDRISASSASADSASAALPLARPCTLRTFTIGETDDDDNSDSAAPPPIRVSIPEWDSTDLGSFLWPSALLLADYIHRQWRSHIVGKTVLELGAGRCLNGIHCAKIGAQAVILTDADPAVLRDAEVIVRLNGLVSRSPASSAAASSSSSLSALSPSVSVMPLVWGEFCPRTRALRGRVDVLIGADVFYDGLDFESVFATVSFFGMPFLTAYQNRGEGLRRFRLLARKWRIAMERLEWECDIGEMLQRAEERRVNSIEEGVPGAPLPSSPSSVTSVRCRSSASLHENVSLELLLFAPEPVRHAAEN